MSHTETLPRPDHKTPDYTSAEFHLPASVEDREMEYREFNDIHEATAWLQKAAETFGSIKPHGQLEEIDHYDQYGDDGYYHRDWEGLLENGSLATKLNKIGIAAHTHIRRDENIVKSILGNPKRHNDGNGAGSLKRVYDKQYTSTFTLTDEKGGEYTFSSDLTYPRDEHKVAIGEPLSGNYKISYITGKKGYGFEVDADYDVNANPKNQDNEEIEKFIAIASDFKNMLISKLATHDPETYKLLQKLIDYNKYD